MLANYLETQDYQKLLERQVKQAVEFAGNDQMIIYLDPVDEDKLTVLLSTTATQSFASVSIPLPGEPARSFPRGTSSLIIHSRPSWRKPERSSTSI